MNFQFPFNTLVYGAFTRPMFGVFGFFGGGFFFFIVVVFLSSSAFLLLLFSISLYTTCCNTYRSFLAARAQLGGSEARHLNQGDAAISLNTTTTHSSHSNPFKPTAARQLVLAFLFLFGTGLITKTGWL